MYVCTDVRRANDVAVDFRRSMTRRMVGGPQRNQQIQPPLTGELCANGESQACNDEEGQPVAAALAMGDEATNEWSQAKIPNRASDRRDPEGRSGASHGCWMISSAGSSGRDPLCQIWWR